MDKLTKAQRRAAAKAAKAVKLQAAPVATPESASPAPAAPAAPAESTPKVVSKVVSKVVGNLQVKSGQSYRGARGEWYAVLQAHDGKPAQGYLEETAKKPPSLPKSGRAENPSGWLRYFIRHGVATIVQPKT